ncbi:uncharacterized protein LOC126481410 [Schistocerca serialis cubense]|uniref:uncharacterized protein LOC126481410 n=1 Tax=Schistocerca serialis cubense TaxID=2023355 RepID=UPI00214E74B5|nr:uncharacterized protein LOC126481410 [Schistocerca serialis cubense]
MSEIPEEILHTPKRRCTRKRTFSDESSLSQDSSCSQESIELHDLQPLVLKMIKRRKENTFLGSEGLNAARDLASKLISRRIITAAGPLEKIWIACALSEITAVIKTPLSVQNELVTLTFIVEQLEEIISEEQEIRNSCVTLMKSLVETNILCLCFSLDQSDDVERFLIRVFDTMFLLVRYDKDCDTKEHIYEILRQLCHKMAINRFPAQCVDIVLHHFLYEKVNDAFLLAYKVISSIPAFVQSLCRVVHLRLHAGPIPENDFVVNIDVFNLIKKLHKLIPNSIAPVISSLELCLCSENNEEKLNAFQLLTHLYTEGNCEGKYIFLWKAFLERLQTDPLGQEFGLAHISDFLIKKPLLRKDLFELLMFYSTMPDASSREQVVNEIVRSSFYYFTIGQMIVISDAYLVDIVAYRRYDVSVSVRHAALYGLAEMYEHCSSQQKLISLSNFEVTAKLTWLLGLILEVFTKETSSWRDKTTVRYFLYNKMLPTHVCTTEKMKYLIHMWNVANYDCEAIFHSVQNFSCLVQN